MLSAAFSLFSFSLSMLKTTFEGVSNHSGLLTNLGFIGDKKKKYRLRLKKGRMGRKTPLFPQI
jgi:hypothetical protein